MILNLTQHPASKEQIEAGVLNLEGNALQDLKALITFNKIPSKLELDIRAQLVANLASHAGAKKAMIGGAPYFMAPLEKALKEQGIIPCYAFSERVSSEKIVDGKTIKINEFKHLGFIEC